MCGINGIISFQKKEIKDTLAKMNYLILHRGPDSKGCFIDKKPQYNIGMAMTRLSIIDLHTGNQPIFNDDKSLSIVFNGEIYNYLQLRDKLLNEEVLFKTTTDTEVILKLYEKYGVESFKMLNGMFAFSIYDKKKQQVIIARDFFGEKPLYYTQNNNDFYWASELKSIVSVISEKQTLSKTALNLFFKLTYVPAPYTIYKDIHKLEANHFLVFDLQDSTFTLNKIHTETKSKISSNIHFDEAKKQVYDLVNKSIETRSIADVEIGTFLSGGVDSSIVSLLLTQQNAQPINTFSIGFKKKSFDETDKSRVIAKMIGSKHHEFIIDEMDLQKHLSEILLNFDEPFADSSALPTYLVAHKTAQHLKVALTGDGGDEVFGGYNKYYMGKINKQYTRFIPERIHNSFKNIFQYTFKQTEDKRGFIFKLNKLLNSIDYNNNFYWNIISLGYTDQDNILLPKYYLNDIFEHFQNRLDIISPQKLTDFRHVDKLISLEGDMLVKVDRTSMLNSLETRAPFLNKDIWDYTLSLPENYLIKGNNKKYILKKTFEKFFPENFLEKSKMGFGVPVGDWLRSDLKKELDSYIEPVFLSKQNIFDQQKIIPLVKNHIDGIKDNSFQIWTFYVFQKWYINNKEKIDIS